MLGVKIEVIPIVVNIICFLTYALRGGEPGKAIYWGGTVILAIGLYIMKG